MANKSSGTVTLASGVKVTINIAKSVTVIKGDAWEGRLSETIVLREVTVNAVCPDGSTINGGDIKNLNDMFADDRDMIAKGAVARVSGTGLCFSKASYDQVMELYNALDADSDFPEYAEITEKKEQAEAAETTKEAQKIIEAAEREIASSGKLMTAAEVSVWKRNYNNVVNEGGEGYVPTRISQEQYEYAKAKIANL